MTRSERALLPGGWLMDEAIGPRFALVARSRCWRIGSATPLPGVGADWLAQRGLRAALLPPDRYIAEVV